MLAASYTALAALRAAVQSLASPTRDYPEGRATRPFPVVVQTAPKRRQMDAPPRQFGADFLYTKSFKQNLKLARDMRYVMHGNRFRHPQPNH